MRYIFFVFLCIVLAFSFINGIACAAPHIVSWNSTGGNTTNKDSTTDLMYLVNPGDIIKFCVTTDEVCDFTWEVNKKEVYNTSGNTSSRFTFEVPELNCSQDPSKCIWEIHVKAFNDTGEDHQEWVISTLSSEEAPDIFDSFTDKKYKNRTETDPWGRPLPEWLGSSDQPADKAFLIGNHLVSLRTPSNITQGTWIFWYKYSFKETGQAGNHVTFYPIAYNCWGGYSSDTGRIFGVTWQKNSDAHHHYGTMQGENGAHYSFSMEYDGAGWYENGEWQKMILIIKDNYYYVYKEVIHETLLPEGKIMFENYVYEPVLSENLIQYIAIYMRDQNDDNKPHIDNIEVYKNKYLFPEKRVYIGNYSYNHTNAGKIYGSDYSGKYAFLYKEGIIVEGRGVTLKEIAEAINDSSIFYYDENTKTAISYKDLVVDEGAELIIRDETLKFHSDYDGELSFVLDYGSRLYVENSTITSDTSHYWVWNNAGATTHWSNEASTYWWHFDFQTYGPPHYSGHRPLDVAFHGEFTIINSTVDNFAHLFLAAPYEVKIIDSKFTNMHEIDIGNYEPLGSDYMPPIEFAKGNKSFFLYTNDVETVNMTIKNTTFSGYESPLNITFSLNSHRDKYNIYDVNAENEYIVVKESRSATGYQSHSCYMDGSSNVWGNIYTRDSYIASELGLVNCKFKDVLITDGIFTDRDGREKQKAAYVKYYLDVKVVNSSGNPVENATVTAKVEQNWTLDDMKTNHYPVENMGVERPYATGNYTCFYHHYRWVDGQPINETYTTKTGRTPLPSEDPAHTLIITDYKKYRDLETEKIKQENFTYTITASKEGKTASLSGLDIDESWYRENPNTPTKTVVCNIDTGACWVEGVSTGTIKGKVTEKDTGLPIEDATITANSHSTKTNSTGDYVLSDLLPKNYTITASKDGYHSETKTAQVLAGQTITVNFQLEKDKTPPTISDVNISSVTANSALITWTTDEPATSLVKYGTSSGNYTQQEEDESYKTSHSINLTGLKENTTYYLVVNSTDKAGNSVQSEEFSFKTNVNLTPELPHIVYIDTDGTGDLNCDGTDDHVEINAAISYINSIGGGIVHLNASTYIINDSINLCSNLTLEGDGEDITIIKLQDQNNRENWAPFVADGIRNTIVQHFTVDGNKHNQTGLGINSDVDAFHIYNSDNITVQHVKMIDFWTDGVEFSHSKDSEVRNCSIIQAGHEGLRGIYSSNITFSNNYVHSAGTGNAGIRIYESSNCTIENNYFNVYGFGILINPQGGVPCGNNIYSDNYIEGHYGLPAIALWPSGTTVSNETFIRNIIARTDGTQEPHGHGIHIWTKGTASIEDIKIINNVINNAIKSGIYVEDGADVSNIIAKNNIIVNNHEYGIYGNVLSSYNDVWNNKWNYGGGASAGEGDISADPLFASPPDDFHLKSESGRWDGTTWVKDDVTSPCIDAGVPYEEDPVFGDYRNEPSPNGGRINMGAYGNTMEASLSVTEAYNISGYVKYENGTGVFNAHVTNNVTDAEDHTDESGYYILRGFRNGTYLITASKHAVSNSIVVTIAGEDVRDANITLAVGEGDTSPPLIFFTSPLTNRTSENCVYVNVTVVDESSTSAFINWNNTLAAYWSFNAVNNESMTPDFSDNNNHGRLGDGDMTEMPVLMDGKFGRALRFDGVDDFVIVNDSQSLDGFSNGEITIEAWIKPILGSRGSIVNKYLYNYTIPINERVYELDVKEDGRIGFALSSNGAGNGTVWLSSEMKVKNNTWTHIAAVSDGETMKIYINGVQDNNTKPAPERIHDSPYDLYIGRWQWSPTDWDHPFNGLIDELRIWNRALSPEEINASFASGALRHNFTDLADGVYSYYAYAIDTAGNYNRTPTRYIEVNTSAPETKPPAIISYSPSNLTPTQYVGRTYTFTVTTDQPVTSTWMLDGEDLNHSAQSWTHTWSAAEEGTHNITYIGTNDNGSVSLTWIVKIIENNPPVISSLENQTGVVGVPWTYDISALVHDPDGDSLTVTTDDDNIIVEGFALHFLYSAPVREKPVNVTVTDSGGLSDTATMFVTVTEKSVLYIKDAKVHPNTEISVPVYIVCNQSTTGVEFRMSFNSSVLSLLNVSKGELASSTWSEPQKSKLGEGEYRIGIVGTIPDAIEAGESGSIVVLNFNVVGKPGDKTAIKMSNVVLVDKDSKEMNGISINGTIFIYDKYDNPYDSYVRGTVRYACNQTSIPNATVKLIGDDRVFTTYTDENGIFMISEIPAGNYTISASKDGFMENATVSINVSTGDTITIDIILYIKGDLNNDGKASQIGDVQQMWNAWSGDVFTLPDYVYDLNGNGDPADVVDVAMIWNAWKGEIVLS